MVYVAFKIVKAINDWRMIVGQHLKPIKLFILLKLNCSIIDFLFVIVFWFLTSLPKRHRIYRGGLPTFMSNQIFRYNCCITPMQVTILLSTFPRHCARAIKLPLKKCCIGSEPLATMCSIWLARDLNLWLPAPETNALSLDKSSFILKCHGPCLG